VNSRRSRSLQVWVHAPVQRRANLVDAGQLDPSGTDAFVTTIHAFARQGRFTMTLSMFVVAAVAPQ
jgi:hypothetical protein